MIQIIKITDLLECIPVFIQKKYHSEKLINDKVINIIIKCVAQLDLNYSPDFIQILAEDITDKYSHESLEDIAECLKKGRQGNYGTSYNKLNMMVISDWMTKHLEEKAHAREKMIKQKFQISKEPLAVVDYEAYKTRIKSKITGTAKPDREVLAGYIEKICIAFNITLDELYSTSRKVEVVNGRHAIQNFQRNYLKWINRQIKEHWEGS